MAKIKGNKQFLQMKLSREPVQEPASVKFSSSNLSKRAPAVHPTLLAQAARVEKFLKEIGQPGMSEAVQLAVNATARERFTVAIAGEFSRGKSTFLNRLLGKDILPVGNLPTTALLTRIDGEEEEGIVPLNRHGKAGKKLSLAQASWDNLVADHLGGKQPEGSVRVTVNDPWLKATGIELIDMPGAGDLDETRAKVISKALLTSDAVIMTVAATAALSMSERLFIEQRLIARKVPFLMLILTKMDQVPLKERSMVVQYVQAKLKQWQMDIPVFLPCQVELPDDQYQSIMGMDKIKNQLEAWSKDPARQELMERWLAAHILTQLYDAREFMGQQQALLEMDKAKRRQILEQRQAELENAAIDWEELQNQFLARSVQCGQKLQDLAGTYTGNITEKLQYEASMTGNPQKWWNESYPYRIKVELTNMASAFQKTASATVAQDAAWLDQTIQKHFKIRLGNGRTAVSGAAIPKEMSGRRQVEFEDLSKERNTIRVGTAVLTVAGALICAGIGVLPLVVTMGVGTGSSIVTEKLFKDKVEQQRQAILEALRVNVPELVEKAAAESERCVIEIYDDILKQARLRKENWLEMQRKGLEQADGSDDAERKNQLLSQRKELEDCIQQLEARN